MTCGTAPPPTQTRSRLEGQGAGDGSSDALDLEPPALSKLDVMGAVVRRSGPHLIEATVIPAVLFYTCLVTAGLGVAYVVALGWAYAAVCRRLVWRLAIPPILVLSVIGITVRTLVAVVSRSSFLYFLQPILGTVAMGGVFLLSVGIGRPLIGSLAGEFWEIAPEAAARPAVLRLFRHLTFLWAAVNLTTAAMTMTLLVSLPTAEFLALKQVTGLIITGVAVFVTVSFSLRTARREGLAVLPSARRLLAVASPALPFQPTS